MTKEVLTTDEIHEMFKSFGQSQASKLPKFKDPKKKDWDRFDREIEFWTRFWNDEFNPAIRLEPHFVKALIGSESSFSLEPTPQNAGHAGLARGLIQITDETLKILNSDAGNEVKDFKFKFSEKGYLNSYKKNPTANLKGLNILDDYYAELNSTSPSS